MALWESILIIVILVILLIVIYNVFFKPETLQMAGIRNAHHVKYLANNQLPKNSNQSSDFAFAVWIFIEDWNTNYGEQKPFILAASPSMATEAPAGTNPGPPMWMDDIGFDSRCNQNPESPQIVPFYKFAAALDAYSNDLLFGIQTLINNPNMSYPPSTQYFCMQEVPESIAPNSTFETFRIKNIDLQKWVCIIVSVEQSNLDIYLHGKLIKSFVLPGLFNGMNNDDIWIGDKNSFSGQISRFQYFPTSINPQEAYNIYRGLGSNILGDFFEKYKLKIELLEYGKLQGKPITI